MHPVLFQLGPVEVQSYAVFMVLAFVVAGAVRRRETRRLGHIRLPGYRWVLVGALLGAVLGSKLGMLLFMPWQGMEALLQAALSFDFTGKTVIGGLVGGYIGVLLAKRAVGIQQHTGDAFAVALPLAQAVARIGCLLHGCCYGRAWSGPLAVELGGLMRHPAPIYEAGADLALAGWLWSRRDAGYPNGNLFRRYLVGYALIRFSTELLRGDTGLRAGPLTLVQLLCIGVAAGFGILIWRSERR